jgi:AraC-like DNA-binding protein
MLLPRAAGSSRGLPFAAWPPILVTWGPGGSSEPHAHHAWHLVLARSGELAVRVGSLAAEQRAGAVLTAPDALHAVDARGLDLFILFVDPEGDIGAALRGPIADPVRLFDAETAQRLRAALPAGELDEASVAAALPKVLEVLGATVPARARMHPAVRRALAIIRTLPAEEELSLERLAQHAKLSPSRLQHAFRESVGLALRPYILWARLLRASEATFKGNTLTSAAHTAGFADAAHMTRTFRRMFGVTPAEMRRATVGR